MFSLLSGLTFGDHEVKLIQGVGAKLCAYSAEKLIYVRLTKRLQIWGEGNL
jgi:hypothetical protein